MDELGLYEEQEGEEEKITGVTVSQKLHITSQRLSVGNIVNIENAGQTSALDIDEKKRLGARLKKFREERHISQEELAAIVGCTGQYISDVERGK